MIAPDAGQRLLLAIDHGTSGVKACLATGRGELLAYTFEPVGLHLAPGGFAEQDPEEWWRALVVTCRRLIQTERVPVGQIGAMCCSSTWSTTVAVDPAGHPIAPAMTWLDSRGAPHIRRLMRGRINVNGYGLTRILRWVRRTGGGPALSGKDDIAHLLTWQAEQPEVYRQAHMFLPAKDYLNARLTGRLAATADSITLFWCTDNRRLDRIRYDPGLIRLLGIDSAKLPPLVPSASVLGPLSPQAATELGLPPGVQVVCGAPDLHAAAIGSGAVADFEGHCYLGTSAWLLAHVPFAKTDVFHSIASLPSAVPGRYFCANEQDVAGGALAWLRDRLFFAQDELAATEAPQDCYRQFDRMVAGVPPGADSLLFAPWLNGERSPLDDHHLRGAWFNLKLTHTRAHLIRAVFEGVALNLRWLLHYVERFCGRKFARLNAIGGGAESAVWCQIVADVLDRPIHQMAEPIQANARGAALLGAVAMGWIGFEDIADLVPSATTFQPDPEQRALYDRSFDAFKSLHAANRGLFRSLNR